MDVEDAEIVTGTEVGLLADTDPKAVFKSQEAVTATLEMIAAKVAGFEGDPSTAKGRQAIIAMASKVTRSKTALDKAGLQITEQIFSHCTSGHTFGERPAGVDPLGATIAQRKTVLESFEGCRRWMLVAWTILWSESLR